MSKKYKNSRWLEKAAGKLRETLAGTPGMDLKRQIPMNIPYVIVFYLADKLAWLYRFCRGDSLIERLGALYLNFSAAFDNPVPSFYFYDLLAGAAAAALVKAAVYLKGKNAKKFRQGKEYGSARWGTAKDIAPYIDPVFDNNILLTQTERLTMDSRPKKPKYARNKNVVVIGEGVIIGLSQATFRKRRAATA